MCANSQHINATATTTVTVDTVSVDFGSIDPHHNPMPTPITENLATRSSVLRTSRRDVRIVVSILLVLFFCGTSNAKSEPLFAPPPAPAHDEILLVNTRAVGTACSDEAMLRGLRCRRLVTTPQGRTEWHATDWRQALSSRQSMPTIFYVHGNRVSEGRDVADGLRVYRSFQTHRGLVGPVRFVILSWPADPIPGPIKDYVVKAHRTTPVAWQFAWLLDKLPAETPISLVGYSYGTRVVSGATHLLAGGQLGPLRLAPRTPRRPIRTALLAAAYDADWIEPGNAYGRSLAITERMVLVTNQRDPAMRFYHLTNGRGRIHALGKSGVHQPLALGGAIARMAVVDVTSDVGRSHALTSYLAADKKMDLLWRQLLSPVKVSDAPMAAVRGGVRQPLH